jgi:hypothetical protein
MDGKQQLLKPWHRSSCCLKQSHFAEPKGLKRPADWLQSVQDAKHGFRFGSGLYFAEDLSKSLSYAAWLKRDQDVAECLCSARPPRHH